MCTAFMFIDFIAATLDDESYWLVALSEVSEKLIVLVPS